MKENSKSPGGRPRQESIDNKTYVVSTRLNTFEYLKFEELMDASGKEKSKVLRELVSRG